MPRKIALGIIIFLALAVAIFSALFVRFYGVMPQSTYSLFANQSPLKSTDKVLIVAPHQDDETLGAAGLIMQAVSAKVPVKIIYATDGNKHGLKNARHQEAISAIISLGLKESDLTFFDYPDEELNEQAEFPNKLAAFIVSYHPTIVVTTLPQDTHPDHAVCGQVVQNLWQSNHSFTPYYFLVHYHRYPRPVGYHPEAYLLPPLRLISTEYTWLSLPLSQDQENRKYLAIQNYKTQMSLKNPVLRELLLSFVRQNEMFAFPLN